MSLFQTSVLKKYLKAQDKEVIDAGFERFKAYFHDPEIQENIRQAKEEQFQEGFLRELFVNVLGYTLNPTANYNLTTEYKNERGAKKADGAILNKGKALAVIELKGTDTADLDKINDQAFSYKNHHTNCVYVITSNFEKLRFFIENSVDNETFDLFNLTRSEFEVMWLCLHADNLLSGIPLKVKKDSLLQEEQVTEQLYRDYSKFKTDLWQSLVKNHPDHDQLTLFKKTQKLLDRMLFIFFAEDKGLLPPNSITRIIERWNVLGREDAYKPLYEIFKQYFGYLNTGRKGKESLDDIFAYNGGLFEPDELLQQAVIDDEVLKPHIEKMTNYNFESDVDVNILGHIFEHSLNEIENIKARLEGQEIDKSKTKRKKEGVYYTPKYITKYIVENTLGKLCEEKKLELEISDDVYEEAKRRSRKRLDNLQAYRQWLLELKICDPACGSGAFLNQALEFLIEEHRYLDELTAKYHGDPMVLSDVENRILEQNLYGVDINEESVEIAKLSLWLRTARKGRRLSALNNNIKCGNSLIADPEVAGDKAFDWHKEFPEVFARGGFDVVIGNPPYVRAEALKEFRPYFEKNYQVYHSASDLFAYFYELGTSIVKHEKGLFGVISNTFDKTTAGKVLRAFLSENTSFQNYVDFTSVRVFQDATTYPVIIIFSTGLEENNQFDYTKIPKERAGITIDIDGEDQIVVLQSSLLKDSWSFLPKEKVSILNRINEFRSVKDTYGKTFYGVKTALNDAFIIENDWEYSEHIKSILEGKDIKKWYTSELSKKLILFKSGWSKDHYEEDSELELQKKLEQEYPKIMSHLLQYQERAKKRYDQGEYWWELRNCAYYDLFDKPKIIFPNLQNTNKFCLDDKGVFINAPAVFLPVASKTLLCILNSKLIWEFLKTICVVRSGGYIEVKPQYFEQIPIPSLKNEKQFEEKADEIITNTMEIQNVQRSLLELVDSKFNIEKLSNKLQNWTGLNFKDFLQELKKKKVELSLKEEAEWMEYFNEQKQKAQELQSEINRIDREIDQMVYELYGLTEEEIKIVEGE